MKREVIRFAARLINESGINMLNEPRRSKKWRVLILILMIFVGLLSVSMSTINNFGNFKEFIKTISWVGAATLILSKILVTIYCENALSEILHQMDRHIYIYPDEGLLNVQYEWYLEEKNIVKILHYVCVTHIVAVVMYCLPHFAEFVLFKQFRHQLYPGWTPWKLDNQTALRFTVLLQILEGISATWCLCFTLVFTIVVVLEFLRQFKRLRYAIGTLKQRTLMVLPKNTMVTQTKRNLMCDRIIGENIVNCFKHHRMLRK